MCYYLVAPEIKINPRMFFIVAIVMLLVTMQWAPTTISANQDFTKRKKTSAKVSNIGNSSASVRDLRILAPFPPFLA